MSFDDFSTDPNIGTEWTQYVYYDTIDYVTTTWNSSEQVLDFVSMAGTGVNTSLIGLYRTGSARSATDSVTLTVRAFSQTGGTFGQLGLMIGDTAQPGILDSNEKYEWHIRYTGSGYRLRARKDVGTGSFDLFSESLGNSFSGPVKLDIVRNGDDYEFYANDVLKHTATSYSSAVHDTFVNYQITFGGDSPATGTVDDFGIGGGGGGGGGSYSGWQAANNTAGGLDEDHDGDGVTNGIEYFLGGAGDTTGFTALPGVDSTGGTLSTTWTKASDYPGTYGTDFRVETSSTLLPGSWVVEPLGVNVTITGDEVEYSFPAGTKNFARLVVAGP